MRLYYNKQIQYRILSLENHTKEKGKIFINLFVSFRFTRIQGSWGGRGGVVVGSPGVGGASNSSSSGASWRSGTPSPPLSDEGAPMTPSPWPTPAIPSSSHHQANITNHNNPNTSGSSSCSTPGSTTTLDEGIVLDYLGEQHPRKKKVSDLNSNHFNQCQKFSLSHFLE